MQTLGIDQTLKQALSENRLWTCETEMKLYQEDGEKRVEAVLWRGNVWLDHRCFSDYNNTPTTWDCSVSLSAASKASSFLVGDTRVFGQ